MNRISRSTQWKIAGALWMIVILLLLSTCIDSTDIDILNIDRDDDTMTISVGPNVSIDEVYVWVSKECRDIMVLPPIEPVPVQVWQRGPRWTKTNRTKFLFRCTRP